MVRPSVNFGEIVESIRHYVPPADGLDSPYALDATNLYNVTPDTLTTLIEGIAKRDYDPQKCAFYLSHRTFKDLMENDDMMYVVGGAGDSFRGRPIRVDQTMPDDCVLFMAPDAVSLGGKVYHPGMIAYADLSE